MAQLTHPGGAERAPRGSVPRRLVAAAAVLLALVAGLAITGPASPAGAVPTAPAPHDDYDVYPSVGVFPAGCDASGDNILDNVAFSRNGGPTDTLRNLESSLQPGDTVTMTWTGFADGCADATISLANKRAQSPTFNPDDQQELILPFSYCGTTTDVSCGDAEKGFSLSIDVPARTDACNVQMDAVVGTPLKNVGKPPYGSFYGSDLRAQYGGHEGPSTLIDAANFGGDCPNPTPSYECAEGGIRVTYDNAQTYDQKVRVYNEGVLQSTVTVPADDSASFVVPVAEGSTFDIVSKLFDSQLDYTFDEYDNGGKPRDCEQPPPSTTTTTTTTTSTPPTTAPPTTAPPTTASPTTLRTEVLGDVTTPVVAGAPLARTGTDVKPLLFLAGVLLALGGAMVALARAQGLRLLPAGTRRRRRGR